jgi:hypothetical protein
MIDTKELELGIDVLESRSVCCLHPLHCRPYLLLLLGISGDVDRHDDAIEMDYQGMRDVEGIMYELARVSSLQLTQTGGNIQN